MLRRIATALQRVVSRSMPDPFALAIVLTALTAAAAALTMEPGDTLRWHRLARAWVDEATSSAGLTFAAQMALVLVTGHALALSSPVRRALRALATLPRSPASAAALVAAVACAASVVHWGLGAVVGALFARQVAHEASARGFAPRRALLGAAAYSGFVVWHGGLSGSAPLAVASADHRFASLIDSAAYPGGVIPVGATLGSPLNLVITGGLCLIVPALYFLLGRAGVGADDDSSALAPAPVELATDDDTPAGWLNALHNSPGTNIAVGAIGLAAVVALNRAGELPIGLGAIILAFLFLGLLTHRSLRAYVDAFTAGAAGAGAILLQFPFYFGILGLMRAGGLVERVSDALVAASGPQTFPVVAFWAAGLANFFVPSGGGQWVVQGAVLLGAGSRLGVDPAVTVMAFSYGDAWTNLLQPFWALPLLGILGLQARHIIGYTALTLLVVGATISAALLAFA